MENGLAKLGGKNNFGEIWEKGLTSAILCDRIVAISGYGRAVVVSALELNIRNKAFWHK